MTVEPIVSLVSSYAYTFTCSCARDKNAQNKNGKPNQKLKINRTSTPCWTLVRSVSDVWSCDAHHTSEALFTDELTTSEQDRNQRGRKGFRPPPLEKYVGHETFSENSSPPPVSQAGYGLASEVGSCDGNVPCTLLSRSSSCTKFAPEIRHIRWPLEVRSLAEVGKGWFLVRAQKLNKNKFSYDQCRNSRAIVTKQGQTKTLREGKNP